MAEFWAEEDQEITVVGDVLMHRDGSTKEGKHVEIDVPSWEPREWPLVLYNAGLDITATLPVGIRAEITVKRGTLRTGADGMPLAGDMPLHFFWSFVGATPAMTTEAMPENQGTEDPPPVVPDGTPPPPPARSETRFAETREREERERASINRAVALKAASNIVPIIAGIPDNIEQGVDATLSIARRFEQYLQGE